VKYHSSLYEQVFDRFNDPKYNYNYPYGSVLSSTYELLKYRKAQGCHSKTQSPRSVTQLVFSGLCFCSLAAWGFVTGGTNAELNYTPLLHLRARARASAESRETSPPPQSGDRNFRAMGSSSPPSGGQHQPAFLSFYVSFPTNFLALYSLYLPGDALVLHGFA
jgi:hypothetical protein